MIERIKRWWFNFVESLKSEERKIWDEIAKLDDIDPKNWAKLADLNHRLANGYAACMSHAYVNHNYDDAEYYRFVIRIAEQNREYYRSKLRSQQVPVA